MMEAAAVLGNTPSIARKSYVDPRLLDHFAAGETIDPKRLDSAESELRALLYREGDVVAAAEERLTGEVAGAVATAASQSARPGARHATDRRAPSRVGRRPSGQLELKTARRWGVVSRSGRAYGVQHS